METTEFLYKIIELVILVLTALAGRYLIPWLKDKVNFSHVNEALVWAETFVKTAEMIVKGEKLGEEKLELVTMWMHDKLNELGIKMTDDQIRALIESAVYNINKQKA